MAEIRALESMLEGENDFIRIMNLKDKIHKLTMEMNGVNVCEIGDGGECLNCGA